MRRHTTAAILLAGLLPVAACSSSDTNSATDESKAPAASKSVDCTDQLLSQAEYMENCSSATPDEEDVQDATGLKFGDKYRWPDGLEVTVLDARKITQYGEYEEPAAKGDLEFRVRLKLTNHGTEPIKLDQVSLIIEGATSGGEAATTTFDVDSDPLEGRLAPGPTVTKTDDAVLETRYGQDIVITVQRWSETFDLQFPEYTGRIQT